MSQKIFPNSQRKSSLSTFSEITTKIFIQNLSPCRICLSEDKISDKELFSYCQCKGSIENMHEQCIKLWIKQKLQNSEDQIKEEILKGGFIKCQLCHEKIYCLVDDLKKCKSGQRFCADIRSKGICKILMSIIFTTLLLSLIGFFLSAILNSQDQSSVKVVLIALLGLVSLIFLSFTLFIGKQIFIYVQYVIVQIKSIDKLKIDDSNIQKTKTRRKLNIEDIA